MECGAYNADEERYPIQHGAMITYSAAIHTDGVLASYRWCRTTSTTTCPLLTPYRAPRANAIAERATRTLRAESLDHVLVLGERHLQTVLRESAACSNTERPHRRLALAPPLRRGPARPDPTAPSCRVVAGPVLGGRHHVYQRAE